MDKGGGLEDQQQQQQDDIHTSKLFVTNMDGNVHRGLKRRSKSNCSNKSSKSFLSPSEPSADLQ